ncbi:MAG: glycine-rich protein [Acidimicrobiia bacterium]
MQVRRVLAGVSLIGVVGGGAVPAAQAAPVTEQFELTFAPVDWVVPAEVCTLEVELRGTDGGPIVRNEQVITAGGPGAIVTGTLEVTPGEVLTVVVGGRGEPGYVQEDDLDTPVPGGAGGYNGGGDGGSVPESHAFALHRAAGAGGGGASEVRRGGEVLALAGGGGGAGRENDGGGAAGGVGADGEGAQGQGGGGAAGDQPGVAGSDDDGATTAGDGQPGQGGAGADVKGDFDTWVNAGGGGGGGLAGGGGGGEWGAAAVSAGGGGGGSSLVPAGGEVLDVGHFGQGLVVVTYEADPGCADPAEPDPTTTTTAAPTTTTVAPAPRPVPGGPARPIAARPRYTG